ncbi:hypothetical protein [Streptomyces anatolicus]|nr:hypothetical protein [Streptomyces anatolicus]
MTIAQFIAEHGEDVLNAVRCVRFAYAVWRVTKDVRRKRHST